MPSTISSFIERDLAGRIRSDQVAPSGLTLPALARHYGVSFSPVREALRHLIAEGVLLKRPNGRVEVNPSGPQGGRASTQPHIPAPGPPRQAEQLEADLAAEIIGRSLRGDDAYLREEATAARHGVGRTAIRQVFGRLAGRGLIEHIPRCGWKVRPFDVDDLAAYLQVRETLELKALELARTRLRDEDLRAMLAGNAADPDEPRLDNRLHAYLIERSGNPYLGEFFGRHGAYYTTILDYAAPETRHVAEMARQHRAILEALIDRDWPAARRALAHHIRSQQPIVEELLRGLGHESARPRSLEAAAR